MADTELEVLTDQLDELLASGVEDEEEALEVAAIAGMMKRLGADASALREADAWRTGAGDSLLAEAWELIDVDAYGEALDACVSDSATDEEVEEALLDLDELVAAALWCGRADAVAGLCREAEDTVRSAPECFAAMSAWGKDIAMLADVAHNPGLYGFWLAVADAKPLEDS